MVISRKPDEKCIPDEQGNWGFTEPDWDEFFRVIRGNGPCNKTRLALRRMSYQQGQWVQQAVLHGDVSTPPAA